MAGQNVPGFAVLRTFGYENVPARAILSASGAGTIVGSFFGAYTLNLSAITAAMMAGPDAHPDRSKRWITTVTSGSFYLILGLGASAATALVSASPPILITAIAGLALFGALASSVTSALEEPAHRLVAIITFLVVVSGVTIAGIGSAFWGLAVGGIVMLWLGWRRRPKPDHVSTQSARGVHGARHRRRRGTLGLPAAALCRRDARRPPLPSARWRAADLER
jgi:benzoate membrane transport protein